MQNFIVLGYVPDTNIQITFGMWLLLGTALALSLVLWVLHRRHSVRNYVIARSWARTIRQQQLA